MESVEGPLGIGRAYRVQWSDRLSSLVGFVIVTGLAVAMFDESPGGRTQLTVWGLLGIGVVAMVAGLEALASFYNRIVLCKNAIEYHTLWSTTWLHFDEITGRREYRAYRKIGGGPRLRIVSNNQEVPMLDFQDIYNFDDAFWAWFKSLPDLGSGYWSP